MVDNQTASSNPRVQFDMDSDLVMDKVLAFHDENPLRLICKDDDPGAVAEYHDALIAYYRDNSGETDPEIIAACNRLLAYD